MTHRIIRDPEDLNQHDPQTITVNRRGGVETVEALADDINDDPTLIEILFPVAVIATADRLRTTVNRLNPRKKPRLKPCPFDCQCLCHDMRGFAAEHPGQPCYRKDPQ